MTSPTKNQRLAVAISLYDRWDELQGLLELLRLNWKTGPELYIVVTTTAEAAQLPAWVNRSFVNEFSFGSAYSLPPRPGSRWQLFHDRIYGAFKQQLRIRTLDAISRGCATAMQSGRDYTLHLHAAAWPLKEEVLTIVLNHMQHQPYFFAGRGYGRKYIDAKHPAGDIDDNFFVIDNAFARRTNFWQFDVSRDADIIGNEGRLARRVYELCSEEQVHYFEDFSSPTDYIFPPGTDQRRLQPYNYHAPTGLLRSHDMSMQAKLCADYGYHGPFLDQVIAQYQR